MKQHIKFSLLLAFCLVQNNYAQSDNGSEIIISEEHLSELIYKIKQKRDSIFYANQSYVKGLQSKSATQNQGALNGSFQDKSKDLEYQLMLARMNQLDTKMDYLSLLIQKQNQPQPIETTKYIADSTSYTAKTYESVTNADLLQKVNALQNEIQSMKTTHKPEPNNIIIPERTVVPVAAIAAIPTDKQTTITNNYYTESPHIPVQQSVRDTLVIEKKIVSNYDELVKKYSKSSETILFDNNSYKVNASYHTTLDQLVALCNNNTTIDLYLKGFASKTGNAKYNEKLSLQRTETVKQYLISKGIHPTRILSQYHGVDYASTNEENARRVTITYIVRR